MSGDKLPIVERLELARKDKLLFDEPTSPALIDEAAASITELRYLLGRLCDAYELVCVDTGKNYHQSQCSVYAHCRHLIAKLEQSQ